MSPISCFAGVNIWKLREKSMLWKDNITMKYVLQLNIIGIEKARIVASTVYIEK